MIPIGAMSEAIGVVCVSNLRYRRCQVARLAVGIKSISAVRAITKRLVLSHPAAAQRNHRAAAQAERISFRILNRELAFNPDRAVIDNRYLCWHFPIMASQGVI